MQFASRTVTRLAQAEMAKSAAEVALEEPLAVFANGLHLATLMRLPGDERDLAAGFCLSEGFVGKPSSILLIAFCGQAMEPDSSESVEPPNRVDLTIASGDLRTQGDSLLQIRSGCGRITPSSVDFQGLPVVKSRTTVRRDVLLGLLHHLTSVPRLYGRTGGVHAAALFSSDGSLIVLREDIGRHNALDKVGGWAALRGVPVGEMVALSTGRTSHEMVAKAARFGLPVLVSVSAATWLAIEMAERLGITLVGYARGSRAICYTHPQRIIP